MLRDLLYIIHTFRINGLKGIPDPDGAGDVSASNVEAAGGEAGDGSLGGVADVLLAGGRVVDRADEDGFAGLTKYTHTKRKEKNVSQSRLSFLLLALLLSCLYSMLE